MVPIITLISGMSIPLCILRTQIKLLHHLITMEEVLQLDLSYLNSSRTYMNVSKSFSDSNANNAKRSLKVIITLFI